jgi:hypothetical protein
MSATDVYWGYRWIRLFEHLAFGPFVKINEKCQPFM